MDSAFGIDHGEISKIGRHRKTLAPEQMQAKKDQQLAGFRRSQKIKGQLRAVGTKASNAMDTKVSVRDVGTAAGAAPTKVGTGLSRVLSAKPAVTGAAVLGGTGYALYRTGDKRRKVKGYQ